MQSFVIFALICNFESDKKIFGFSLVETWYYSSLINSPSWSVKILTQTEGVIVIYCCCHKMCTNIRRNINFSNIFQFIIQGSFWVALN